MPQTNFDHTVLIVDDEQMIGKALGRILKGIHVSHVYESSGQAALDRIKNTEKAFSLILSDQRMPGMSGSEFLARAKEISPDTVRFLITGYSDATAITAAVNEGSIHRYIVKPWDSDILVKTIQNGLNQYEQMLEGHRLFNLAKEQNAKLYSLNIDLKKRTTAHIKMIARLDREIEKYRAKLDNQREHQDFLGEMESILKTHDLLGEEQLNSLYAVVLTLLYRQFQEIAVRNGFEMPRNI